ncbi:hypothetical protein [Kocuria palustris]|uniref:hypothetical protein n=1 Tax=Kocuria palustris TaxID=71999 RepID=UPI0033262994
MGYAARRKREQRALRREARNLGTGLELLVAPSPTSGPGAKFLDRDLSLIRAGLLYADRVELLSPSALMLSGVASISDPTAMIALLNQLDADTLAHLGLRGDPAKFQAVLHQLQATMRLSREQRRSLTAAQRSALDEVHARLEQAVSQPTTRVKLESMLEEAGAPELVEALDAGVLRVRTDIGAADPEAMFASYLEALRAALVSPTTNLLVDDQVASVARALIESGQVSPNQLAVARASRARSGAGLISHLPAFLGADVTSVLSARAELEAPLGRYRSAVSELTERMKLGPFDEGHGDEIADFWRDEVRPTVDSLRADLSVSRLTRDAALNVASDTKALVSGGAVFFGLDWVAEAPTMAAAAAGTVATTVKVAADAYKGRQQRREDAKSHGMFYLLELDRRLQHRE